MISLNPIPFVGANSRTKGALRMEPTAVLEKPSPPPQAKGLDEEAVSGGLPESPTPNFSVSAFHNFRIS